MLRKATGALLSVFLICSFLPRASAAAANDSYNQYLQAHSGAEHPAAPVDVDLTAYSATQGHARTVSGAGGRTGSFVETTEQGSIEWTVQIETAGLYAIGISYYTQGGKGSPIVRTLHIDGEVPYDQARGITFSRAYVNEEPPAVDESGNETRSVQAEKPMWLYSDCRDSNGYSPGPLMFHFSRGSHTIRLEAVKEPMVIGGLRLHNPQQPPDYRTYKSQNAGKPAAVNAAPIEIQGEDAVLKSDSMLYQLSDRSSSATKPNSPERTLLNTIGAQKWSGAGQWLCWEFTVREAGYYKMSMRFRQNFTPGQASYRRILIGGSTPFAELEEVKFPYGNKWQVETLGDGSQAYEFYFEPGTYTLKMEVVLGELADMILRVNDSMKALNEIYLSLLMVIGPTPDKNRDYHFDALLPEELNRLQKESEKLRALYGEFLVLGGTGGSQAQVLKNLADLAGKMAGNPYRIASLFKQFGSSISSLGSWVTAAKKQPLEVDYILLTGGAETPKAQGGFFESLLFGIRQFIASFSADYYSIGRGGQDRSVKVWLSTGRDQSNALIHMAGNAFTPQKGIGADIQLVQPGTLLTATLAGRGPDVALSLDQNIPVNYALRGAVADLSGFDGFAEVQKRFQPSAMTPFSFGGKVCGLPETQSFYVMFYRTDILESLNLEPPDTWDDVVAMLPVLNRNNLNFGLPLPMSRVAAGIGFPAYAMFLYQNGGRFYAADNRKAELDSDAATKAFKKWCDFYTQYSLPYEYDFQNRFRSGEIPIGIADYGTYNILSVFAPELNGLWRFGLVPGTKTANGIDRSIAGSATACVIMESAADKEAAWEFLKWWTSAPAQEFFGREIESIMGTAARYQTANIEALHSIPWSAQDLNILLEQWEHTKGIPEAPGSYMTSRYVDFAFKQVVLGNTAETNPVQVLVNQNKLINEEIKAKRKEFGLPH